MFSKIKAGDIVLVSLDGDATSLFEGTRSFLTPVKVSKTTPARFTAAGIVYRKTDGYSVPRGRHCEPYTKERDQTADLEAYDKTASVVSSINNYLYKFGKKRVERNTKNLHTILKQAEILAALIDEGSI